MTPHWHAQVTEAVRTQVPANKKIERGKVENFGAATRVDDDGWYEVATVGRPVRADELVDLRLAAGPPGEGEPTYRVMAAVDATEKLRVQVGAHAPVTGLYLWASRVPRGMLAKSLLKALETMTAGGLVDRLATGRLDAVPAQVPPVRGLSGDHARAFNACTTPGVRAIWGPPGTGKTTVLSGAVQELLDQGRRVLLVSGTNVAVDNVLTRVVAARDPAAGEIVRVGAPHLAEIQRDGRVSLPRLVEARLSELADRRRAVQRQLVDLDNSAELTTLVRLEERLAGYDHAPYLEARQRIDAAALVGQRAEAVDDALALVNQAHAERERRRAVLAAAEQDQQASNAAGRLLYQADAAREELAAAETRRNRLRDEVTAADARYQDAVYEHAWANSHSALTRWRQRRTIRELAADVAVCERDLAAATTAARVGDEQFDVRSRELMARIQRLESEAAPFDRRLIRQLGLDVVQARGALRDASAAMARAEESHSRALRALRNAERNSVVTEADHELVASTEEAGLEAAFEQRRLQRIVAEPLLARRCELTDQHENLLVEWEKQQIQAEPEIIAASKAKRTIAFLGDFCQLGPISPDGLPKNATLAGWLTRDCFQLVGIEQPTDAIGHPGCVSLLTTHRFGRRVVELANRVAYHGHLVANTQAPR